jgi:hypothetical protein
MNFLELVRYCLSGEDLSARQWVKDAKRSGFVWSSIEEPKTVSDPRERNLYAGLTEMFCLRFHQPVPSWTDNIVELPEINLMPFSRLQSLANERLRVAWNIITYADYLDVL